MNEMWSLVDIDFIQNWCERTGCMLLMPEDVERLKKVKYALNKFFDSEGYLEFSELVEAEKIMNEYF